MLLWGLVAGLFLGMKYGYYPAELNSELLADEIIHARLAGILAKQ